jgi:hypothetical protein
MGALSFRNLIIGDISLARAFKSIYLSTSFFEMFLANTLINPFAP